MRRFFVVTLVWILAGSAPALSQTAQGSSAATIPVEVLAIDPAIAEGEISIGRDYWTAAPVIAMQPARIARGIMIEKSSRRPQVLALAILGSPETTDSGAARLDGSPDKQAWCELPSAFAVSSWQNFIVDCYQDKNADGALDTQYRGHLHGDVAVMLASVDTPTTIDPLPYRVATSPELPLMEVGYVSCGNSSEKVAADVTNLRYGTYFRFTKGGKFAPRVCKDVATLLETKSDGKLYQFDRFKVVVSESDGALFTRLVEGIPAGTVLGNLRMDRPLLDVTARVPHIDDLLVDEKAPVYIASIPETTSVAVAGQNFLTATVAHGLTGKLRTATSSRNWGTKEVFPAGTAVFGVAMQGTSQGRTIEPTIVWCAPRRTKYKELISQCFVPMPYGFALIKNYKPFHVEYLNSTPLGVDPPIVDRAEVEFGGRIELAVRYERAKDDAIYVEWSVSYRSEPIWQRLVLRLREDGSARMIVGGAAISIRPGADKKTAAIEIVGGEFKVGADAMPREAR